jgi:hypothetical protein
MCNKNQQFLASGLRTNLLWHDFSGHAKISHLSQAGAAKNLRFVLRLFIDYQ